MYISHLSKSYSWVQELLEVERVGGGYLILFSYLSPLVLSTVHLMLDRYKLKRCVNEEEKYCKSSTIYTPHSHTQGYLQCFTMYYYFLFLGMENSHIHFINMDQDG